MPGAAGSIAAGWSARLDSHRADMDDSADLLFAGGTLTPLEQLQRARLLERLDGAHPDLRRAWPVRRIAAAWLAAAVAVAAALAVPGPRPAALAPPDERVSVAPGIPHLTGQRLRIVPPAYTGLPPRDAGLDVRAPIGSHLEWTLTFAPQPAAAALAFAGGPAAPLTRRDATWTTQRVLDRSLLYRSRRGAARQPPARLHRLDAVADAPPQVRVIAPERSLSRVTPGQRRWPLTFEARDDYGVAATAQLHLTIAEGDGENVKFREIVVTVRGTGSGTLERFAVAPDLAALKFAAGSDLVAQLVVSDNRTPGPQTARSPSVILRWPPAGADGEGMEGVVTRVMPAYFRSQRQVIIDAEALLKDRPHLAADRFLARSDGIGADQRLLRMRYGQFLGEEQEGKTPPPPTADAATPTAAQPAFGGETDALVDYGHVHDESEAATLLDPNTRTTLKAALDAMWQSELNLRQGAPQAALPFAYKALGLIKQVQQATRIFLARVGPDLPVVDETRRLTGKRDGLDHRDLPPLAAVPADPAAAAAWAAAGDGPRRRPPSSPGSRRGPAASRRVPPIRSPLLPRSMRSGAIPAASRAAAPCANWCGARCRGRPRESFAVTAATRPGRHYLDALGGDR